MKNKRTEQSKQRNCNKMFVGEASSVTNHEKKFNTGFQNIHLMHRNRKYNASLDFSLENPFSLLCLVIAFIAHYKFNNTGMQCPAIITVTNNQYYYWPTFFVLLLFSVVQKNNKMRKKLTGCNRIPCAWRQEISQMHCWRLRNRGRWCSVHEPVSFSGAGTDTTACSYDR